MPKLTIQGSGDFEIERGTRLVNAIRDAGVDIGHRCGGYAGCTTCRVEFLAGEPEAITQAEKKKLEQAGLAGQVRLSCQILVNEDMSVRPLMVMSEQGWPDTGPEPHEEITPDPEWLTLSSD